MKEKTEVVIGPDDAAIIFRADGSEEIVLPQKEESAETQVDSPEWRALVVAVFVANRDLYDEISEHLQAELESRSNDEEILN